MPQSSLDCDKFLLHHSPSYCLLGAIHLPPSQFIDHEESCECSRIPLQILLNFFVAVILDNLDLDEEKKKEKLQQVVEKKTVRKVPAHLYLLTACGPKLISAPKISTAGVEVPNLTEADMKNFYETGENKDMKEAAVYSTEQFAFPHQQSAPTGTLQRQSSELSQLQLLSVDSNVSTVSSHHEKFQGERMSTLSRTHL